MTVVRQRRRSASRRELAAAVGLGVLFVGLAVLFDGAFGIVLALLLVGLWQLVARGVRRLRGGAGGAAPVREARLEVYADRISYLRGSAQVELRREHGDLLGVREMGREAHLYLVDTHSGTGGIGLGAFDLDEVGVAAREHGWRWQEQASSDLADLPEHEVVVRDGQVGGLPRALVLAPVAAAALAVVALVVVAPAFVQPAWLVYPLVAVLVLVGGLLEVLVVVVYSRRYRVAVRVRPDRLTVQTGCMPPVQVRRAALRSAHAGRRWVRVRTTAGVLPVWIPLRPKRSEVLVALTSYGWPVTDRTGPGG